MSQSLISIVVPIYNEQENLPALRQRMEQVLEATEYDWELLLVNDGSRDASESMIRAFHRDNPRIKLIQLSRNFGHQPAVTAGIHHARGQCVILIDGDLQDPPELIPDMLAQWRAGAKVVLAERASRQEGGVRGLGFRLFYPLLNYLSEMPQGPQAGIFGLMDREVVDHLKRLPERNRFLPGLRGWLGFPRATVRYHRQERAAGKPKQTLRKLIKYAFDGMVSFSYKPLRLATYCGFIVAGIGFLTAILFVIRRLFFHDPAATGFTTLLSMMMFIGGIQLITIGILGEYIGRIYEEVKQRPLYIVQETLGLESDEAARPPRPENALQ